MISATVVITTKNRRDELRSAVASALLQSARPEVLVIDDGSTDGSAEMIRANFPSVRLVRHDASAGYIARRNEAAAQARGDVIVSIDDDAEFVSRDTIVQTLTDFDESRAIGAVAIPYIEPRKENRLLQAPPSSEGAWVTDSFVGTAHAVRRELFLKVGGYREEFVHQGEEREFSLRLLDAGYVVRLGTAEPIVHYESPKRDVSRMDYYGRRNDVLFATLAVPLRFLPTHLIGTTVNGVAFGLKSGRLRTAIVGTAAGYVDSLRFLTRRTAVSPQSYSLQRLLRKRGPFPLQKLLENPLLSHGAQGRPE